MTTMHVHMYTEYNFYTPFPETVEGGGGGEERNGACRAQGVCVGVEGEKGAGRQRQRGEQEPG